VKLVTSDAHAGLVAAIGATLPGATWQRCRTHYADVAGGALIPCRVRGGVVAARADAAHRAGDAVVLQCPDEGVGPELGPMTALAEIPQFCSLKFPTPGRFRS
jgi:hypothetical protein